MMAVILAGGRGQAEALTMVIPKPLLPIGDVPIIEVVIRQIAIGYQEGLQSCSDIWLSFLLQPLGMGLAGE